MYFGLASTAYMYAFKLKFARVLTIYKNHPVGNFRHKHETIKCNGPYSLELPTWNGAIHLMFQLEFPVFLCKW